MITQVLPRKLDYIGDMYPASDTNSRRIIHHLSTIRRHLYPDYREFATLLGWDTDDVIEFELTHDPDLDPYDVVHYIEGLLHA